LTNKEEITLNIVKPEIEFVTSLLKEHTPKSILVTHTRVHGVTVYDAHLEGILGGKDGCQCHFFIDVQGTVYKGKEEKYVSDLSEDSIVILLEANLDGSKMADVQKESLFELTKELKNRLSLTDVVRNTDLNGLNFPYDEFVKELVFVPELPLEKVIVEVSLDEETKTKESVEEPVVKVQGKKSRKKRS
jgi:hypothetical protein